MVSSKRKQLACQECRKRKRKCNGNSPCSNCIKWSTKCNSTDKDNRGFKYTTTYVKSLEREVKSLNYLLVSLKSSSENRRNELISKLKLNQSSLNSPILENFSRPISPSLKTTILPDQGSPVTDFNLSDDVFAVDQLRAVKETTERGEPAIYGPSSIYIPQTINPVSSYNEQKVTDFENFHDQSILDSIMNFFIWRYPDVTMFIHRESFLTDFYKSKGDIKVSVTYCSEELIYALCCLGSFNYKSDSNMKPPSYFYKIARDLIFDKLRKDSFSSIVMIQALLTLALYDLGRGNNVSAWLLSGIAIRLGEHKGLSHDPLNWSSDSGSSILSDYDTRVRSRIYWGCYLTEHFIANVLGRASILNSTQATIRVSEDLPRLIGIENFCYKDPLNEAYDIRVDVSGHLKVLDDMYCLCEQFKSLIFCKDTILLNDTLTTLRHLENFTKKMFSWREKLPEYIQWNLEKLELEGHNQVLMNIRNQYYLALLSFHRPFISKHLFCSDSESISTKLCTEIIRELEISINSFLKVQDISKCSLITVYNTILAIMIIMSILTRSDNTASQNKLETLNFFVSLLKHMAPSWEIANKYYNSIMNTYTALNKQYQQEKNITTTSSDSTCLVSAKEDSVYAQEIQLSESSEFLLDFESDLFSSNDLPSIFNSMLKEITNFDKSGFVGFDLCSDL